jgi:hypothetical protein
MARKIKRSDMANGGTARDNKSTIRSGAVLGSTQVRKAGFGKRPQGRGQIR